MNCAEVQSHLEAFLSGKTCGEESRSIFRHLASCEDCAAMLRGADRIESLLAAEPEIEPSEDLQSRFRARLTEHRSRVGEIRNDGFFRTWWKLFLEWSLPRQLATAGALTALLVLGFYVGRTMIDDTLAPAPLVSDIAIAENLPLLLDLQVIENMDLLEDFDAIQNVSERSLTTPSTVQ